VYESATEAVARARVGEGPTLLECRTYRWRGHVGPSINEDVGVKRKDELKEWLPRDPIRRARERLQCAGVTQDFFEKVDEQVKAEVDQAVAYARESPLPSASDLARHVFV
jgi:TPP-dependent pyruvate/acetoin dehydrogenase alpha subunit